MNALSNSRPNLPSQKEAIAAALELYGDARPLVVADIGSQAGWLKAASHDPRNLYLSGPMGLSPSVALGLAVSRPGQQVLCIVGDGALAMNLSALATIQGAGVNNLALLLVDNGVYEFTASIPSPTRALDWLAVGRAMFGPEACHALADLDADRWAGALRPGLIVATISQSGKPPPLGMNPAQIRAMFLEAVRS